MRLLGEYGDEEALSWGEREHLTKMRAIEEFGSAKTIYVSHGADGDWFVVEPQVGLLESVAGTPLDIELAVSRLVESGRTVYELKPKLGRNRFGRQRTERLEPSWRPTVYLVGGLLLGALVRSIT